MLSKTDITGGRTSGKLSDGQNKTTTNQFINQLGGDIYKYHAEKLGDFTLGIMGGYANAKGKTINHTSKKGARNTLDGYSAGLYGTWYQNGANATGLFAETWMQYNWFNASVKGDGLEEEKYNLNGLTASVGGGYNLNVHTWTSPEGIKGEFWLQPHLQAVWMGVTPDTHQENNGTVVQGSGKNNLQTKAGIRASWKVKSSLDKDTGREFRPYIEANWLHNTHEFGVKMSGDNQLLSGSRNQGEIKTGIEGGDYSKSVSEWRSRISGRRPREQCYLRSAGDKIQLLIICRPSFLRAGNPVERKMAALRH